MSPIDTLSLRRLIANLGHFLTGALDADGVAALATQCVLVGHMLYASLPVRVGDAERALPEANHEADGEHGGEGITA